MSNFLKNAGYDSEEIYFHRENQKLIQEAKKKGQKSPKPEDPGQPNNVIPIDRARKAKNASPGAVADPGTKKKAA